MKKSDDRVNWTIYNTSNSNLPFNWIFTIVIDAQGNKWIGTAGGLAKFDGVNWTIYNTSNSNLPFNWIFTDVRLEVYDVLGRKVKTILDERLEVGLFFPHS